MNYKEVRTLRTIEKNLTADDPDLAELLRPSVGRRKLWSYHLAGWAIVFAVIGTALGNVVYLLIAGLLATGVSLGWAMQAACDDELNRNLR